MLYSNIVKKKFKEEKIIKIMQMLKDRAYMLKKVRDYFFEKNVLEVDCPILLKTCTIDRYIDVIQADLGNKKIGFLHTSPEYVMKRLLSYYPIKNIYYLGHVFRQDEVGSYHNPEFTMIEWYRTDITYATFIEEIIAIIKLFLGDVKYEAISYRDLFKIFLKIDYLTISNESLFKLIKEKITITDEIDKDDKTDLLQISMSHLIEPLLDDDKITIVYDFPKEQAALSQLKTKKDNEVVGERFEFYFNGLELANGYHELTDHAEQKKRLIAENNKRKDMNKRTYPIDEKFIEALSTQKMGDCYGVSVGFDRLMMLKHDSKKIDDVLILSWNNI